MAEKSVKQPKGSKLDTLKRAEYLSEVGRVETWDTSSWPTWTVTGRMLPERCDVRVPSTLSQGIGAEGRFQLTLTVIQSHIAARCALEKGSSTIFEIADVVRSALSFLDLCINNQNGEASTIPVFEPIFDPIFHIVDAGYCFDVQGDKSNLTMPWAAAAVPEFPTALHTRSYRSRALPSPHLRVLSDGS